VTARARTLLSVLALGLCLAAAGCAALGAAADTQSALSKAGYHDVSVNIESGSGLSAGGVVGVACSGPSGNILQDVTHAEQVVWDSYPGRFGGVTIVKGSGECVGPVCGSNEDEVASAAYAQLANAFGPRPHGLDQATGRLPGWVIPLAIVVPVLIIAFVIFLVILNTRQRKRWQSRQAAATVSPPPWQPGQPAPPWQPGQPWEPPPPPATPARPAPPQAAPSAAPPEPEAPSDSQSEPPDQPAPPNLPGSSPERAG
jgi:hypothetical protein